MTLHISLFGNLHITDDSGQSLRPLRSRARRLLVYLLLHRHRRLLRQHVAFTLWPDLVEHEALAGLRRALSDLQTGLPALPDNHRWVTVSGEEVGWNSTAPYWLDVEVFEELIRQATPAALHTTVELYRGDLLMTWDDDWVLAERERLSQLHLDALRRLVTHHRALGNYEAALGLTRQALVFDALSESTHRNLIALHYESGDRAAALLAYEHLQALLRAELDVDPMPETQALQAAVVQGIPLTIVSSQSETTALASIDGRKLPSPVGRDEDLRSLRAYWDHLITGHGRLVTLSGEAGVGKSHLVLHFADEVARSGGLALIGHCYEFERALPYQPIVEMLRSAAPLLQHSDLAPAHRATLSHLVPDVLGAAGIPASELNPLSADLRTLLFESLLQAFLALAQSQPLLLLVEDAHWAAESTLDWLTYIAPRLDAHPVLVLMTHRTDQVGANHTLIRVRSRLAREATVWSLDLKPLSPAAHRELVAELSGLPDDQVEPLAERLFRETVGNPLFLHEIVRGLIESDQITINDGRWTGSFVQAALSSKVPLPDSLREAVNMRLERLAPASKMFIQTAAVAGGVFGYETVRQAGGWVEEHALEAIEDLLANGVVRQRDGTDDFAFAHHLIREIIYATLTVPRRAYWHRRLADTLVQRANRLPAAQRRAMAGQITHHTLQCKDFARVFQWAPLAAEHAYGVYAHADALNALEVASDAWDQLPGNPDIDLVASERQYVDILLDRAALMPYVGRSIEEHGQMLKAAADILARHSDERLHAKYSLCQSDYLAGLSQYEHAFRVAFNAYERYLALGDRRGAAHGLYRAADYKITTSQNREGRRLFEQALALYEAVGDRTGEAICLSGLAWSRLNLGEVEFALKHLIRALELSERRADKLGMARTCYTLAAAWSYYHNAARVQEFAENSMRLYRAVGYTLTSYRSLMYIAVAALLRGESERARGLVEQSCIEAHAYHDSWLEGWASQILGRLAMERGDLYDAEQRLSHAYELRRESGEVQNQISDLTWLGRLRLAQGEPDAALKHTTQAIVQLESLWGEFYVWEMPDVFMGHADALAANNDGTHAKAYLQRARDTLVQFAAQIHDSSVRDIYLAYPVNARILAAWETSHIPPLGLPASSLHK